MQSLRVRMNYLSGRIDDEAEAGLKVNERQMQEWSALRWIIALVEEAHPDLAAPARNPYWKRRLEVATATRRQPSYETREIERFMAEFRLSLSDVARRFGLKLTDVYMMRQGLIDPMPLLEPLRRDREAAHLAVREIAKELEATAPRERDWTEPQEAADAQD